MSFSLYLTAPSAQSIARERARLDKAIRRSEIESSLMEILLGVTLACALFVFFGAPPSINALLGALFGMMGGLLAASIALRLVDVRQLGNRAFTLAIALISVLNGLVSAALILRLAPSWEGPVILCVVASSAISLLLLIALLHSMQTIQQRLNYFKERRFALRALPRSCRQRVRAWLSDPEIARYVRDVVRYRRALVVGEFLMLKAQHEGRVSAPVRREVCRVVEHPVQRLLNALAAWLRGVEDRVRAFRDAFAMPFAYS